MGDFMPSNIYYEYFFLNVSDEQDKIFNVVYNGKRPTRPLRSKKQLEEGLEKNTVKIDVNLNELKKLYPTVDGKQESLMKIIGKEMIQSIKINERGEVDLDQNKINPQCLTIQGVNIEKDAMVVEEAKEDSHEKKKFKTEDLKQILLKGRKMFKRITYLILIYLVQRKVKKITDQDQDQVFEEYELLYNVHIINTHEKFIERSGLTGRSLEEGGS